MPLPMYKYSKSGPTGGETFTVTCFTCGMPSSKEWAQLVMSRPCSPDLSVPFYPFLLQVTPPPGALFSENGTTYLCAFCHALIEAQWNSYEGKKEPLAPIQRKYVIHKFICAVCGVETYRKRVRALPFQEFPFLSKTRQPGSITLGNNPLAVVCLDCSETLWAQSCEYDRWGLPVHKRHFNWMARPPPPEDSVEATVARLPSGETQLPRCPPTDPLVPPKTNEPTAQPEAIPPIKYPRPRANSVVVSPRGEGSGSGTGSLLSQQILQQQAKYCQQQQQSLGHRQGTSPLALTRGPQTSPRKVTPHIYLESGSGSAASSLEGVNPHGHGQGQPPIVTVAPMSLQHSVDGSRKNSVVYTQSRIEDRSYPNSKYEISSSSSSYARISGSSGHHESSHHPSSIPQFLHHLVPYYSPPDPSWSQLRPSNSNEDVTEYGDADSGGGRRYPSSSLAGGAAAWRQRESPNVLQHYPHVYPSPNNSHHNERATSEPNFSSPPPLLGHPLSLSALFPQLRVLQATTPPNSGVRAESPASRNSSSPRDYEIYRASHSRIGVLMDHHHHTSRIRAHSPSPKRHSHSRGPNNSHNSSDDDEAPSIAGRIIKRAHSNPVRTSLSPADANVRVEPLASEYYRSVQLQHRSSPFVDVLMDRGAGGGGGNSSADGDAMADGDADETQPSLSDGGEYQQGSRRRVDFLLPKKRHWEPSFFQGSCSSPSEIPPVDVDVEDKRPSTSSSTNPSEIQSVLAKKRKFSMSHHHDRGRSMKSDTNFDQEESSGVVGRRHTSSAGSGSNKHGAIDLSMPQSTSQESDSRNSRPVSHSTSKFSIAYLCKSETVPVQVEENYVEPPYSLYKPELEALPLDRTATSTSPSGHYDDCELGVRRSHVPDLSSQQDKIAEDEENPSTVLHSLESSTSLLSLQKVSKKVDAGESLSLKVDNSLTKKAREDFKAKEQEEEENLVLREIRGKQSSFLSQLGLITPKEKSGPDLKSLHARSERGTVSPLKLKEMCLTRISYPQPNAGSKTGFKSEEIDTAQALFLQTLGLRPTTMTEKSRRENNADVICSHQIQAKSSDANYDADDEKEPSKVPVNPICIKYPKYVPGAADSKRTVDPKEQNQRGPVPAAEKQHCEDATDTVLRIPVVHINQIIDSNSSESEGEEDPVGTTSDRGASKNVQNPSSPSAEIDNFGCLQLLQTSELHWKKSKKLLAKAMHEAKSSSTGLDEQLVRLQTIRRHIDNQKSDWKGTEAAFVELEKQIFQRLENVAKNQQSLPKP